VEGNEKGPNRQSLTDKKMVDVFLEEYIGN
jgi:hypothetical protein